ncbi:MAG: DUF2958 domain-containing protein [Bacteroidetes bacterium]|nr:DUF2958 domain-containing protein [Bacteroidota bacterium]
MKNALKSTSLITSKLAARFKKIGKQPGGDPLVIAKFFNPCGSETWYVTEYDEAEGICFGFITGIWEDEWGYFSLSELQSVKGKQLGLPIERDKYFKEVRWSESGLF